MKKLVILIVSVLTVNTINAQLNDIAFKNLHTASFVNNTVNNERLKPINPTYHYGSYKEASSASTIKNMENTIANYDLKANHVFDTSDRATYRVVFKQKNAKAIVDYNPRGKIISRNERYKNVKLPTKIAVSISQNNKGFYIKKTIVLKKYNRKSEFETTYKVLITNGKKTKTLKIAQ